MWSQPSPKAEMRKTHRALEEELVGSGGAEGGEVAVSEGGGQPASPVSAGSGDLVLVPEAVRASPQGCRAPLGPSLRCPICLSPVPVSASEAPELFRLLHASPCGFVVTQLFISLSHAWLPGEL